VCLRVDQSHISCPPVLPSQTHRQQLRHVFTCKWTRAHFGKYLHETVIAVRYVTWSWFLAIGKGINTSDLHFASNQLRQTRLDIMAHVSRELRPSRHRGVVPPKKPLRFSSSFLRTSISTRICFFACSPTRHPYTHGRTLLCCTRHVK